MANKTIYRAVRIDGFVHGGGGSKFHWWRRTYKQAKTDLDEITAAYDDSFGCVEAHQLPKGEANALLIKQHHETQAQTV